MKKRKRQLSASNAAVCTMAAVDYPKALKRQLKGKGAPWTVHPDGSATPPWANAKPIDLKLLPPGVREAAQRCRKKA